MDPTLSITKSDFLTFMDTPRHLWALKQGIAQQALDPLAVHQMEDGKEVEKLARIYLTELVEQNPDDQLVYQYTCYDGPFEARVDFLIRNTLDDTYHLIEVKSGTKLKPEYLMDLAFQLAILEKHLQVTQCSLMHLNPDYRRQGELDLSQLFIMEDLTHEVIQMLPDILMQRQEALQAAQETRADATAHCLKPKDCPFPDICHPDLPEYSIYNIPRILAKPKQALLDMGVRSIFDVPTSFKLNQKQRQVVDSTQKNRVHIDAELIKTLLDTLAYPLYFLDYESCISAIPLFEGNKPQQQILFQYSLHKREKPGAPLEHFAFLANEPGNPYPGLMTQLKQDLGDSGSIIVWNKTFEMTRHKELMELFPEHAQWLESVNARVFDLMDIPNQMAYYDPQFKGSASIKAVLPVLIPDLSYDSLPINVGTKASVAWWRMNAGEVIGAELETLLSDLHDYCHLDTLAMVRLLEFFQCVLDNEAKG